MLSTITLFDVLVIDNVSKKALDLFSGVANHDPRMANPQAIIVRSSHVDTSRYQNLLAVARAGTGVDNVTVDRASTSGIPVFAARGANANSVNELLFGLLTEYARNTSAAMSYARSIDTSLSDEEIHALVEKEKKRFVGFELADRKLGVIGLGNIGRLVARNALDRGMHVMGYDPLIPREQWGEIDGAVQRANTLFQLVKRSNIVSVHVDLSEKTRHLVNADLISEMLDGTILVNLSREPICEESAVIAALKSGKLKAFITDFPTKLTAKHPKVICTPHIGASTHDAEERSGIMAVRSLNAFLKYGIVENSVNFPTMDEAPRDDVRMRLCIPHQNVPDMISKISGMFGKHGINIGAMHTVTRHALGYMVVDLEQPVDEAALEPIRSMEHVLNLRALRF